MIRLAKYLKPFLVMLIISIVLLFAQAIFELALPDYLSRIVNVGIQQGGVESAVPQALRQSTMDRLGLFMTAQDKADVLGVYTLVQPGSAEAQTYLGQYPVLATEPVYILKNVDKETLNRL